MWTNEENVVVKDRKKRPKFFINKNVGKIKNVKKHVFLKIKNVKNVFNIYDDKGMMTTTMTTTTSIFINSETKNCRYSPSIQHRQMKAEASAVGRFTVDISK